MAVIERNGGGETEADEGPRPLSVEEVVELLVGHVRPLDHMTFPLKNWPCQLVAAIAETASRTPRVNGCSWQARMSTENAVFENEVEVRTVGSYLLPDQFEARVFGLLAANAIKEARAAERGMQGDGYLRLTSVVEDLGLGSNESEDCRRVSGAITRLCAMSLTVSSRVENPYRETRDPYAPQNWSAFRLIESYETPSNENYQRSPVRVGWNSRAYAAIVAAHVGRSETNGSSKVRL